MNTAFHDALNLAWKIHLVEAGFVKRSILETYESERKRIAEDLLDFDAKYAALFSQRRPSVNERSVANQEEIDDGSDEFVQTFKTNQEFTSGYGIAYTPNEFNWSPEHAAKSRLLNPPGNRLRSGRVMPSADVTRVIDASKVHLEQEVPLNGSFRLFIFAGSPTFTKAALADLARNLQRKSSFYAAFEREDIATVSYHERHNPHSRFVTICTTFAAKHDAVEIKDILPPLLARYSDHIYADDILDAAASGVNAIAHDKMGLDAQKGGIIVVRPDGHVGCVVSLVEGSGTADALNEYFGAFVCKPVGKSEIRAQL